MELFIVRIKEKKGTCPAFHELQRLVRDTSEQTSELAAFYDRTACVHECAQLIGLSLKLFDEP